MILNSKILTEEDEVWLDNYLKKGDTSELEAISLGHFNSDIKNVAFNIGSSKSQKLLHKIHLETGIKTGSRFKAYLPALSAAAAVIAVLGLSMYLNRPEKESLEREIVKTEALSNQPTLTLGDGTRIALNDGSEKVLVDNDGLAIRRNEEGQVVYELSKTDANKAAQHTEYNSISTPLGRQYRVVLSDGTKVLLNSVSSIRFPAVFTGDERKVEITGEVYFEVAKSKNKPFKVVCGKQTIEVLGTNFNVNAYDNEHSIKTTLLEGSVKVSKGTESVRLKPGEQAQTTAGIEVVKTPDINSEISWTNGSFYFKDADIETVMRQASRWYDIEVNYKGTIPRKQLNGSISQQVPLHQFLEMLKFAGVNVVTNRKTVTISQ